MFIPFLPPSLVYLYGGVMVVAFLSLCADADARVDSGAPATCP